MSNSSSSLSPSSPPSRDHHISEGDVCIVDFGEGRQYFLTACRSGKDNQVKLGQKGKVYTTGLIGLPYGAVIEVKNSRMVRTEDDLITPPLNLEDADADGDTPSVKLDNRNLVDDNKSQITTQDDIMKLREEGKTGQDIVTELVNNSKSFKGKTEYAKAKYIKRKLKKVRVCIANVFVRNVAAVSSLAVSNVTKTPLPLSPRFARLSTCPGLAS